MNIVFSLNERPTLTIPFDLYAHSPAVNPDNPFDVAGVLHNALFDVVRWQLGDSRFRGTVLDGNLIHSIMVDVIQKASIWSLHCVCVKQEGCPCRNFIDWIRDNFPLPSGEPFPFPRNSFPDQRPGSTAIAQLILGKLPSKDSEAFSSGHRRLHRELDELRGGQSNIGNFHKRVVEFEREVMSDQLDPLTRQTLMISASVARHSMFLALASGRNVSAAPEWVSDDVDGATVGAITGTPAGPGGTVTGAAIGAGIFSLATVFDWW